LPPARWPALSGRPSRRAPRSSTSGPGCWQPGSCSRARAREASIRPEGIVMEAAALMLGPRAAKPSGAAATAAAGASTVAGLVQAPPGGPL
jgi:hypothetical protein